MILLLAVKRERYLEICRKPSSECRKPSSECKSGLTKSLLTDSIKKRLVERVGEHSSAGRASALQAEGHRFEPCCSHQYGPVVQLVRMPACHAGGRGFEPLPGRQPALVAQSVEQ